jgi:membrane-associated phospholipid phosphatase
MRRVRWRLLATVPVAGGVLHARRRIGMPRVASTVLAAAVPVSIAAALPRGRARNVVVWAAHMWCYKVAFEIPYDRPERLRARLTIDAPLLADRVLGGGTPPGQRLQRRLRTRYGVTWLDRAATAVYLAWEIEPHLALASVLLARPDRFAAAAARQAATFDLTLAGYWLTPTAPPWWASEVAGRMAGEVRRVNTRVIRDLRNEPLEQDDNAGSNPWAAMPSDHFASALTAALSLRELSPAAGAAGLAYAFALGCALVYLGEHYVVDLLGGAAVAGAAAVLTQLLRPAGRRLDRAWRRIEP